jgi:hypothetical protein
MIPLTAVEEWVDKLPVTVRGDARSKLRDLARITIDRRVQFLCGAGMSKGSGVPLSADLSLRMMTRLLVGDDQVIDAATKKFPAIAAKYAVETIAEAYKKRYGATELNLLIDSIVTAGEPKPHAGHVALEFLANNGHLKKVYTTNFDRLIESGLGERAKTISDTDSDLEAYATIQRSSRGSLPVLHLHGVAGGDPLFLESNTYELNRPIAKLMIADMVTDTFVWVGYSLTDLDIRGIFLALRDMLAHHGRVKRPFVIHPLLTEADSQEYEWQLANKVWDARGCEFIPGTAEDFLPALVAQVRRTKSEGLVRLMIKKSGGDPGNADEVDKKTSDIIKVCAAGVSDYDQTVEDLARQEGVL